MSLRIWSGAAVGAALLLNAVTAHAQREAFWDNAEALSQIGHIVVIYEENRSTDSYFGLFPGANGLSAAPASAKTQVDATGTPFPQLPPIINTSLPGSPIDTRFPSNLPNAPFLINTYVTPAQLTGDLVHRYYQEQLQIDGGKMDKFALVSDSKGLTMGYWDIHDQTEYKMAQQFVIADNFFHSAFGGSFLNHAFLWCACAYTFPNAPTSLRAVLDANGNLITDGAVTPDGYAINTLRSINLHAPTDTDPTRLVPLQTQATIGDLLTAKGVTWKWYSGGLDNAIAGHPDALFQFHHQAPAFFANMVIGSANQTAHFQDYTKLLSDIANNTLPQVVFYKPYGQFNLHPGYANITDGENHLQTLLAALMASPAYKDMMIIITFDEHGGQWDHVAPPTRDKWGPGSRVPLIVISPFAKKGYVDHTQYDTSSILRTIEDRFGLPNLTSADAPTTVKNLRNTLQ